jgi:hypothetical protein
MPRQAIFAGALVALLAAPALAQTGPSQEQLKQRRAAKVAEAWFTSAGWIDDYDEARAKAKESGKLIFAYFTRTYAH